MRTHQSVQPGHGGNHRDDRSVLLAAYPFDAYPTVVDVGGGVGRLLAAILTATPTAHGVLYDLPQAVAKPQRCCASTQNGNERTPNLDIAACSFMPQRRDNLRD